MTECGWENPFPFMCFFLPALVMGVEVLTSIRKLFECYEHQVKARHFNELSGDSYMCYMYFILFQM